MAQLILTEEEKAADSWLDISDDALGKLCRKACLTIMLRKDDDNPDDRRSVYAASAGVLLCNVVHDANGDNATFTFEGLTKAGHQRGDWQVTVTRLSENASAMAPPPQRPACEKDVPGG